MPFEKRMGKTSINLPTHGLSLPMCNLVDSDTVWFTIVFFICSSKICIIWNKVNYAIPQFLNCLIFLVQCIRYKIVAFNNFSICKIRFQIRCFWHYLFFTAHWWIMWGIVYLAEYSFIHGLTINLCKKYLWTFWFYVQLVLIMPANNAYSYNACMLKWLTYIMQLMK